MYQKYFIAILAVALGVSVFYNVQDKLPKISFSYTDSIPKNVTKLYNEILESEYPFDVSIQKCDSDKGFVYTVANNGGFTGTIYYFDKSGKKIDDYMWGDVVSDSYAPSRVPINTSNCEVLIKNS